LIKTSVPVLGLFGAVACSADTQLATSPLTGAESSARFAISATSRTFQLSSVTPPIECTNTAGAVTTVTGGTLVLSSTGKFTATFATQTTSGGVTTTDAYTEKGTFSQSGSTIVFKVPGPITYSGTIDNGTLTISNYPYCGSTHTAVFNQV
jgi:hypothetical protein